MHTIMRQSSWGPLKAVVFGLIFCVFKPIHAQPATTPSAVESSSVATSSSATTVTPLPASPSEEAPVPKLPKSAAEEFEGLVVRKIEVDGNLRITSVRVLDFMQLRAKKLFLRAVLAEDVRRLWESGFFDDIKVDASKNEDGTLDLRMSVRERPYVREVVFEGNSAIDNEKLREDIEIKDNAVFSNPALRRSIVKIREKYAEKGYFLAEVNSEVIPEKDNEVSIKITIKEGREVRIRRINFVGNHNISSEELKSYMRSAQTGFLGLGSGEPYQKAILEADLQMAQAIYMERGYLMIQFSTPRVMLTPDREGIEISVTVDEGPQFRIKKLDAYELNPEGKEIEPVGGRKKLRSLISMQSGDIFNRAILIQNLQAVKALYKDVGYANVEAEPQVQTNLEKREVSIQIPIRRGPLVYIHRIEVRGNTKTSDRVIRRELTFLEGQLFSEAALNESKNRINALGYFERVDISTERGKRESEIKVFVEVSERPTGTFQIGAGFSSIEQFILTAQIQQANLLGRGQLLALQAQVSGLRQLLSLRFFEPYLFDSDWSASVEVYNQLRIYDAFSQNSTGGSLTVGYPIIAPSLRATLTYTAENVSVNTQSSGTLFGTSAALSFFQRLPLANLFQDGFLSSVRAGILFDTRDNRLFPTNGLFLQASTEFASPVFGSQNEFIRYRVNGRAYYNLGNSWVLRFNADWGFVTSPRTNGVPLFARFFLGGIFDVRGFRLRSIGPRLPLNASLDPNAPLISNGANIGGNMQVYGNLELEFPIIEKVGIRGVVFTDAGNSFNTEQLYCNAARGSPLSSVVDPCNRNLLSLRTSYGVGIRWFSPLGPLRFEWGFPFMPLAFEDKSVFEFTIGNFF